MFQLDERLNSSGFILGDWTLSTVILKNDRNYPWFLLVPRIIDVEELYQLNSEEQLLLMKEIKQLSLIIKDNFQPKKINVASLGNSVRQLHIHCVARSENDPLWPQGIWQNAYQPDVYNEEELKLLLPRLRLLINS